MGIVRRCPRCETMVKPPRVYCSRPCKMNARNKRRRDRNRLSGTCSICGQPAWPWVRCVKCRAKERERRQAERDSTRLPGATGRQKRRTLNSLDPRRNPRMGPRSRKPLNARILDAIKRFDSITEGVWRSDPPSAHIIPLHKFCSPNKGTQDRRVPK